MRNGKSRSAASRHRTGKAALSEGRFPANEDICREILLVEFPEEVPHETAEELDDLSWAYILDDVFSRDTETGMMMWRLLLDIAEPALKSQPRGSRGPAPRLELACRAGP